MSGWGDTLSSFLVAIFVIAIIMFLVRPGSPGVQYVRDISEAMATLTKVVTGQNVATSAKAA